jgi:methylated-DNA-[protein]-cysteine S-methyltransferase
MEAILKTQIGKFYIKFSNDGLSVLSFTLPRKLLSDDSSHEFSKKVEKQLCEYFDGIRKDFDLKLNLSGTDFQKKVWKQLIKVKYGKTASYGELAKKIKLPKGARAIGGANNKNPVMIIVPCHRIIQADGKLGGYAGGVELKQKLLDLESGNK